MITGTVLYALASSSIGAFASANVVDANLALESAFSLVQLRARVVEDVGKAVTNSNGKAGNTDHTAELTSAPDGGHRGPVHGDLKGKAVHSNGPKGQIANSDSESHYGSPQGNGTKKADSLGDTHFDAPEGNTDHTAELTSAPDGGHPGPVHGDPKGKAVQPEGTDSSSCHWSLLTSGDSWGSSLKALTETTVQACREECSKSTGCKAIIFNTADDTCTLLGRHYQDGWCCDGVVSNKDCSESEGTCVMAQPLHGTAPSPTLSDVSDLALEGCMDLCLGDDKCNSIAYLESEQKCRTMAAPYDDFFVPTKHPKVMSNRICPEEGLAQVSSCTIYGDPHVVGFDSVPMHVDPSSLLLSQTEDVSHPGLAGDLWLVRSPHVQIQGRFNFAANGKSFLKGLAVSGDFISNNLLLIGVGHGVGHGKVFWNEEEILPSAPSEYNNSFISAIYHSRELVQDPGRKAQEAGFDIDFPAGVKFAVNRGKNGLGVKITMPKLKGGQDGMCGNFNGDVLDDTIELISKRTGTVQDNERLFRHPFIENSMLNSSAENADV